ncbi:MAG: hypothetical protein PHV56_05725 [Clostridia bacterium]|nr:hypothetical protein [Clostridia bacterium]
MKNEGKYYVSRKYNLLYNGSIFLMLFFFVFDAFVLFFCILDMLGLITISNNLSAIPYIAIAFIFGVLIAKKHWLKFAAYCFQHILTHLFN